MDSQELQRRMAAALMTKLPYGSTEYSLTWKAHVTPARRLIYRLAAQARRTSGSGCSGWPTPDATVRNLEDPTVNERRAAMKAKHGNGNGFGLNIQQAAQLAGWVSPTAMDGNRGSLPARPHDTGIPLSQQVALVSGWATPAARDCKGANSTEHVTVTGSGRKHMDQLANQVVHSGPTPSSFPAPTEKRGALNPAFSLWLMGFPAGWLWNAPASKPAPRFHQRSDGSAGSARSGALATRSSRKSRPSSSKPTGKQGA